MVRLTRAPYVILVGCVLGSAFLGGGQSEAQASEPECRCVEGSGCYHFLKAPVRAPDDPCSCPKCRSARGSCPHRWPSSWNRDCAAGHAMECFLRRHAASWKMVCSEWLDGKCACEEPHPDRCPRCGPNGSPRRAEDLELIARQVKVERLMFGRKRPFVIVKSPHFYFVTDIPELRIVVQGGGSRRLSMHEIAHVYAMRAEEAYRDWIEGLDDRMTLERPSALFVVEKETMRRRISQAYFGHADPEHLYGADAKSISGGYGYNGVAISLERHSNDDGMHFQMRHLVGHLLASTWVTGGGATKILPKWMYVGAAHWLSRLPEKFKGGATFCSGEGQAVSGSGKNWHIKVRRAAGEARPIPIQRVFDAKGLDDVSLEMHRRAWSWFSLHLEEDHDRFVAFLAAIREGTNQRVALRSAFGMEAEEFDRRWRDRVLGRRPSLKPTPAELDAVDPTSAGARARAAIRSERDPDTLGSRIRALHAVAEPVTAATILPRLDVPSDLVREAIVAVLSRTESADVRRWLRTDGLRDTSGFARSQVVRVIGNLRDAEAAEAVVALAGDADWLTRAHVARALGTFGRDAYRPVLVGTLRDRSGKVRVAALDALAALGKKAAPCWSAVADQLGHRAWQVRSAAAQCLGALGTRDSVDALIARMAMEDGRLRQDVRSALKRITNDDLGNDPRHWREWWAREKERKGDPGPRVDTAPEGRYAEDVPVYYGLKVYSRGVGYALDGSSSMGFEVRLEPEWLKKHARSYFPQGTKFELACREIAASLKSLDPRTRFNLYFFRTRARAWESDLVSATPANVNRGVSATVNQAPTPGLSAGGSLRTNYVDVFRLVLDAGRDQQRSARFRGTPDTVYFLTDGKPTVGDITDTDLLLAWFRELNRFARIRVHVITFGKLESNPEFLRRLAEENGGVYTAVPARR